MTNLATNLTSTAATNAEQDALRINGQGVTYAQLHAMAAAVAGTLRANGIQPGDRVVIDGADRIREGQVVEPIPRSGEP